MSENTVYSAKSVGKRLKWYREHVLNLKQKAFSEAIGLSTDSSISQYETGAQRLPLDAAINIMNVYGLSLDFLYFDRRNSLSAEMLNSLLEYEATSKASSKATLKTSKSNDCPES